MYDAHLTSDMDFVVLFVADWAASFVVIVQNEGDAGLGHTSLPVLVHEFLKVVGTHLPDTEKTVRM